MKSDPVNLIKPDGVTVYYKCDKCETRIHFPLYRTIYQSHKCGKCDGYMIPIGVVITET